jgi:hypothetical protein
VKHDDGGRFAVKRLPLGVVPGNMSEDRAIGPGVTVEKNGNVRDADGWIGGDKSAKENSSMKSYRNLRSSTFWTAGM